MTTNYDKLNGIEMEARKILNNEKPSAVWNLAVHAAGPQ